MIAGNGSGRTAFEAKGQSFERNVIRRSIRWYLAYRIRYCQVEEMMEERRPSYRDGIVPPVEVRDRLRMVVVAR